MYVERSVLAMSDDEIDTYVASNRWGRLGTSNSAAEPHVTPIGYVDWEGDIYFMSMRQSRRSRDIAVNSPVALCIDDGVGTADDYTQRRGVVLYGTCAVVDVPNIVQERFLERHELRADEIERRTHDWYRIEVTRRVSWDFRRIPAGSDRKAT